MSTAFGNASPLSPLSPNDASIPVITTSKVIVESVAAIPPAADSMQPVRQKINALMNNIEAAIMGKRETVKFTLVGLLARGHVLIEDVPGVGKTTLARALAKSIDCQ